jgi:hypothetical protein
LNRAGPVDVKSQRPRRIGLRHRSNLLLTMALRVLLKRGMHATFIQKVIICAVAGFAAACLIQWGKVFVEGADKALNDGYEHRTVMDSKKK